MAHEFRDNVVVLTGASAGIGLEVARQLSTQGAILVLAARGAEELEAAAELCRANGAQAVAIPTDVSDRTQCSRLIDSAVSRFGRLDTLINNAGISMHTRLDDLTDITAAETLVKTNYLGSVYCTYFALPHIRKTRGRIVAVSSLTGRTGVPTRTLYAGTKHAMAGFFDSLRIEMKDTGVSVTVAYPGFVATDIAERAIGPDGRPLGTRPVDKNAVMSAEECARRIIRAAGFRKREVMMSPLARVAQFIKLIAPDAVDRLVARGVRRGR